MAEYIPEVPAYEEEPKKKKTLTIVLIVVGVLLLCCCLSIAVLAILNLTGSLDWFAAVPAILAAI